MSLFCIINSSPISLYITLVLILVLISQTLLLPACGKPHDADFDWEQGLNSVDSGDNLDDLSEFCTINKKPYGRSLSKPQDVELIHLLTNDFVATGTRGGAKTKEDKIVDDALAGCPTTEKTTPFIDMDPGFRSVSRKIVNALAAQKTRKDVEKLAAAFKADPRVNYHLFWNSFMKAIQVRDDFRGAELPLGVEFQPEMFIPSEVMTQITSTKDDIFLIDESLGKRNGKENLLFYFREDIGLNSHHQYWHLSHAFDSKRKCTPKDKNVYNCHEDRRGELFWLMHKTILSRYHMDRLAVCLPDLEEYRLTLGGVINTAYYPVVKLKPDGTTVWGERPEGMQWPEAIVLTNDDAKPGVCNTTTLKTEDLVRNLYHIYGAINEGRYVDTKKKSFALTLDVLGNMHEGSDLTPNFDVYGTVHNMGHLFIAQLTNSKDTTGVMGDTSTAMRDPMFYRWHYFVSNNIDEFLRTLPPHEADKGEFPFLWKDVMVESVAIEEVKSCLTTSNSLNTFFKKQQVKITIPRLNTTKRLLFKSLDHRDFNYVIKVQNKGKQKVKGTVRIFIAPVHRIVKPGKQTITRSSLDSTVTTARTIGGSLDGASIFNCKDNRCGCGVPHNLLIPRGREGSGMQFEVIVLITDGKKYVWDFDKEKDEKISGCKLAPVLCSLPGFGGRKYPDLTLPMGYPFDRLPFKAPADVQLSHQRRVETMEDYVKAVANMGLARITITHHNLFVKRQDWNSRENAQDIKQRHRTHMCPNWVKNL
ncbi:Phenoloxidase 3 [Folsomia candida]|uniref:Phenoloxidase 3 n=1 Tax=Folsomia candida TaxID=158441 RepID=A0A226ED91_FOLCA|nr:Phenoloxidase 3 [Folsomia candida]